MSPSGYQPTMKPAYYPKGLGLMLCHSANGRLRLLYFFLAGPGSTVKGGPGTRAKFLITKDSFVADRQKALEFLASEYGYNKVPNEWQESVAKDWKAFLKENRIKSKRVTLDSFSRHGE